MQSVSYSIVSHVYKQVSPHGRNEGGFRRENNLAAIIFHNDKSLHFPYRMIPASRHLETIL